MKRSPLLSIKSRLLPLLAASFVAALSLSSAQAAAPKDHFKVCWTIYAGWMPWGEAKTQGIVVQVGEEIRHQRSTSCNSTTTSNRSTSTPPASSTAAP